MDGKNGQKVKLLLKGCSFCDVAVDTEETSDNIQDVIARNALAPDILPDHSIPLIIHHASGLGDWIREVEKREKTQFIRYVSVIGWWKEDVDGFG